MRSSPAGMLALSCLVAVAISQIASGADGETTAYRPDAAECAAQVDREGQLSLGAHVGSLCSTLTMWWPGNKKRCCATLEGYVGEGGSMAFCLCDAEAVDAVADRIKWLAIDGDHIAEMCSDDFDIVLPYDDNAACPPKAPTPPPGEPASKATPTQADCVAKAEDIGQGALVNSLAGCFFGATDGCCEKVTELAGENGDLEYCLCDPTSTEFLIDAAKTYGIDVPWLVGECADKKYKLPYNFNSHCPTDNTDDGAKASNPSSPASPSPSPASPAPTEAALNTNSSETQPDGPSGNSILSPQEGSTSAVGSKATLGSKSESLNLTVGVVGGVLPSLDECIDRAEDIGQSTLIGKVIPCLSGASSACCSSALELVGGGGPLEFCLCSEEAARFITDETDKLNFDLRGILEGCTLQDEGFDLPFFGNQFCPADR